MDGSLAGKQVGRVEGLWRYPVKSMAGEPLPEVEVSWHGLAGDRRWAFIRDGVTQSGFPWLTLRERGDLGHYRPLLLEPAVPPELMALPTGKAPTAAGALSLLDDAGEVRPMEEIENEVLRFAIAHYRGRMSEVARRLGIGRSTLYRKLESLGIGGNAEEGDAEGVAAR